MLKRIIVSQRINVEESYGEVRDAIDQKWYDFFSEIGVLPILAPNNARLLKTILYEIHFDSVLLTGGNTPVAYGGNAHERDCTDSMLIAYACSKDIPLIGVCRGCQSIALFFGGTLKVVENHVAKRHKISGEFEREVNSFHEFAISDQFFPQELKIASISEDGNIEALRHKEKPLLGIMWHPEREQPFSRCDLDLFKQQCGV